MRRPGPGVAWPRPPPPLPLSAPMIRAISGARLCCIDPAGASGRQLARPALAAAKCQLDNSAAVQDPEDFSGTSAQVAGRILQPAALNPVRAESLSPQRGTAGASGSCIMIRVISHRLWTEAVWNAVVSPAWWIVRPRPV